jgi:hypothetical protein
MFLAPGRKEGLQDCSGFVGEKTGGDFDAMV